MKTYSIEDIEEYFKNKNFDVRVSKNARWIDQKCTMDVVSLVADCIINYVGDNREKTFTVKDIWYSDYSVNNVQDIFSKPDPSKKASNEYDKYFGQPIKLLNYSEVLISKKVGNKYVYKIKEYDLLEFISFKDRNCLIFLQTYIEKVLRDSGIFYLFENFINVPNKETFYNLKQGFNNFTINNTPINGTTECGRIFAKVLNPLSIKYNTYGTIRGNISKEPIEYSILLYNRRNFRDIISNKPKRKTREEYKEDILNNINEKWTNYNINKAKNWLRKFNNQYRDGKSEIEGDNDTEFATQMHHIFPISEYPSIGACIENLIALTPNQHLLKAHPNNNTQNVDKEYQYVCIICKIKRIKENIESSDVPTIYSFINLKYVLNIGLETDEFTAVNELDFNTLISLVSCLHK